MSASAGRAAHRRSAAGEAGGARGGDGGHHRRDEGDFPVEAQAAEVLLLCSIGTGIHLSEQGKRASCTASICTTAWRRTCGTNCKQQACARDASASTELPSTDTLLTAALPLTCCAACAPCSRGSARTTGCGWSAPTRSTWASAPSAPPRRKPPRRTRPSRVLDAARCRLVSAAWSVHWWPHFLAALVSGSLGWACQCSART